ncbi:bifunctional 5,10-methylene-tetrahydrofolate dehydrogenase/5,10-methylene-tetrahydrofolate cyclohydrolase [bacterium]|nr:bifunctional 5,10-methylene-tetrahydrofolate dehydrogenase/5,10-methylene-tetrahydrofolate cyclohydrolase [bacterium]
MVEMIIDGKSISSLVRKEVKERVSLIDRKVTLAVLLVGDDPASSIYVNAKEKAAAEVGISSLVKKVSSGVTQEEINQIVELWGDDPLVDGILVQLPLPSHLDSDELIRKIPSHKDVDGLTPASLGELVRGENRIASCTPKGCMRLLREVGCDLNGKNAIVIGRSILVGFPMAILLTHANATVTLAHSRTRNLEGKIKKSDVVIAATGIPNLIKGNWIKKGAYVLDVGITRTENGLCGDVEYEKACHFAEAITPVPGGVGPMTVAMLLENVSILASFKK